MDGLRQFVDGEATSAGVIIFASMATAQTAGFVGWPVFVSLANGNGVERDFGWQFRRTDLATGVGVGIASLVLVFVVTSLVGIGVDLQIWDREIPSDQAASPVGLGMWCVVFLFAVVAAPLGEEIFFRGLVMRVIQSKLGSIPAVFGSTAIFALLHLSTPDLSVAAVTLSGIGVVGLALGFLVMRTGRLGGAIVAHGTYNLGVLMIDMLSTG